MKKYFSGYILATFCFISGCVYSQHIPGYIGRINTAGYSLGVSLAGESSPTTGVGLVCQHQLTYERVFSRKSSFEANICYSPSKYNLRNYYFYNQDESLPEYYSDFSPDNFIRTYYASASASLKIFRNQFIAPVGRFIKFRIGMFRYGAFKWKEGIPGTFRIIQTSPPAAVSREGYLKTEKNFASGLLFSLGFGKVFPVSDKLLFEFGSNINFNYSSDYGFELFNRNTFSNNIDNYFFSNIFQNLKYRYLVDFQFALKYNF